MTDLSLTSRRPFWAAGLSRIPRTPLLFTAIGLLVLLPVIRLVWEVVLPISAGDTATAMRMLTSAGTWKATGNSLAISAGAMLVSGLIGAPFALLCGLTDLRAKTALAFCLILPLMIPPQIIALSWIHLTGSGSPLLKFLGLAPPPGTPNPVYSSAGMILVMGIEHAPLVFIALRAALRAVPRDLVEAAQAAGARRGRIVRTIVLPLSLPGLAAGLAISFVAALGNFGVPALLGIPAGISTLPTLIYRRLAGFGPSVLPDIAVLAVLIGAIACIGIAAQIILQSRIDARVLGGSSPPARLVLGRMRIVAETACWLVVALILAAPLAALLSTSLISVYGLALGPDTMTLAHFNTVLALAQVERAFINSFVLAGAAAVILALLSIPLAHAMAGSGDGGRLARIIGILVELPHAVPGVVLAIGCILVFLKPLPVVQVSLYGTLWLILAAYLARFLSLSLRPVQAACAALDPAMEEAARACGASSWRRLVTIVAPLVSPAAAAGGVLVFLVCFNELTVSILLWSQGRETLGVVVYALEEGGSPTLAAALSVITISVIVVVMTLVGWAGRKLPDGIIPWRG